MSSRLQEYHQQRAALIAKDTELRTDRAKLASLTSTEAEAEKLVREIRKHEAQKIWANNERLEHAFPGMSFLTAKEVIESTEIFKIVKELPKGALLHAHIEATVDASTLLQFALEYPNVCVSASEVITKESLSRVQPIFQPLPIEESYVEGEAITSAKYVPETYVSARKARSDWPEEMGGPSGFDAWVVRAMVINPSEAYDTHNTTVKIWNKFSSCFSVIRGLICYVPVAKKFLRHLFQSCVDDGIMYAEFRQNFTPLDLLVAEDGRTTVDHVGYLAIFSAELDQFRAELMQAGRGGDFIGAKIIYTVLRFLSSDDIQWYLDDCLALKQKYPQIVAGFDVVGPEDKLNPLLCYLEPFMAFREKCESMGVDLPFVFHAGETLGDGDSTDQNLYDAILLGTKRIGHAFSLVKHPELMRICRERNICCEVCPVSNEILRLTSSIPAHPVSAMLNHGVPIALASDDPGIFNNIGLSYDFFQVLVSSDISGLMTLGVLARDSLCHAFLDDTARAQALTTWDARWKAYIDKIVATKGVF